MAFFWTNLENVYLKKKKKDDQEKQREKTLEMSWTSIGYAPLGLSALKDGQVLVYVNKPFTTRLQCQFPLLQTVFCDKNKNKQKKK